MNSKKEGIFGIVCTLFLLFSPMINPVITVSVSAIALGGYGVYKLTKRKPDS